jgi:hypothetical protein
MGGFGSFGGRFDEKLNEKVEQLVGHQSREDKLAEQLREMGIDPDSLPLKVEDAKRHVWAFLGSWDDFDEVTNKEGDTIGIGAVALELVGSSLGFSKVIVHGKGEDYENYDQSTGKYEEHETTKTLTDKDLTPEQWHDMQRVWEAFRGTLGNRMRVWAQYQGKDEPETVTVKLPNSPSKLKAGQTARIQKGDELIYVKMGGLWGDDVVTDLKTMQPIQPLTGWKVVEVLEE